MSRAFLAGCVIASSTFAVWAAGCMASSYDSAPGVADDDDSLPESGSADCPSTDPQQGASCTQPEGTTCAVGACGTTYVSCRSGRWAQSDAPDPTTACPARVPNPGDACPRCFPDTVVCGYGCVDAQPARSAVCTPDTSGASSGQTWQVRARECPTYDASVRDADQEDGS